MDSRQAVRPGEAAPDFTLPAVQSHGAVSLADYRGKTPVLLALFRGLWCSFCRRHLALLAGVRPKLLAVGVETLAIVATNAERARLYCRFRPIQVPLAADPELTMCRALRIPQLPITPDVQRAVHELKSVIPGRPEPASFDEVSDHYHRQYPYEWNEVDREDYGRAAGLCNGQILVDREGIIRWVNVEGSRQGLSDLFNFPSDEELLAAARESLP